MCISNHSPIFLYVLRVNLTPISFVSTTPSYKRRIILLLSILCGGTSRPRKIQFIWPNSWKLSKLSSIFLAHGLRHTKRIYTRSYWGWKRSSLRYTIIWIAATLLDVATLLVVPLGDVLPQRKKTFSFVVGRRVMTPQNLSYLAWIQR